MIVSPLDYRYGREEMKTIFSEKTRLNIMLNVESAISFPSLILFYMV